jgi:formylglycine-generating enzyme required for sulfatase activity
VNNGVEETPPTSPCADGNSSSEELYADLEGANVGFKHWHPVAVTDRGNELAGQAELGGVWEWTSSVLEKHDGFEPMPLYLGYTGMHLQAARLLREHANNPQLISSTPNTT